jgi:hypothetical protein
VVENISILRSLVIDGSVIWCFLEYVESTRNSLFDNNTHRAMPGEIIGDLHQLMFRWNVCFHCQVYESKRFSG